MSRVASLSLADCSAYLRLGLTELLSIRSLFRHMRYSHSAADGGLGPHTRCRAFEPGAASIVSHVNAPLTISC